jgi:hypothetical protein
MTIHPNLVALESMDLRWNANSGTAEPTVSKICGDQIVRSPAAPNILPGRGGTYQVTVGIERVQKARFVGMGARLDALQCPFFYEK